MTRWRLVFPYDIFQATTVDHTSRIGIEIEQRSLLPRGGIHWLSRRWRFVRIDVALVDLDALRINDMQIQIHLPIPTKRNDEFSLGSGEVLNIERMTTC